MPVKNDNSPLTMIAVFLVLMAFSLFALRVIFVFVRAEVKEVVREVIVEELKQQR